MKLELKEKKVISVLGLPHSGTTIVSNTFNSMENGFCLSEPHWILLSNPKQLTFDKLGHFNFNGIDDIMSGIRKRITNDEFCFGGVKETYRPQDKVVKKYLDHVIDNSDIMIFVFREPKALFNSFIRLAKQMKRKSYMPVSRLIYDYNNFCDKIDTLNSKKLVTLTLEQFCNAGQKGIIKYLNKCGQDKFKIIGKFALNKTNYKYGNNIANNSSNIKKANKDYSLLTKDEVDIIDSELYDKFIKIKNAF